jgi:hypothetical protein
MARVAVQRSVHSRQGKSCKPQVIKRDTLPVVDGMALLTLSRETRSHVVRRSSLLERSLVTRVALNGKSLKLTDRSALMTVGAVQSCMAGHQGKTVRMVPSSLSNDVPAFYGVTLFAIRSHLTTMDIGVAVRATRAGIREDRLGMALGAGDPLV